MSRRKLHRKREVTPKCLRMLDINNDKLEEKQSRKRMRRKVTHFKDE